MKKQYWYAAIAVAFVMLLTVIVVRYKMQASESDPLLERKAGTPKTKEWITMRTYARALQYKLKNDPGDIRSTLALTTLFLQEARITGNYMYYDRAALKCVNKVLQLDSLNFEALTFKSLIYLSQHHFAEGLALAEKARNINPFNAFIYGLLVDGHVEMGHYDSAVANADKMVAIRPDIRSYSRISYLREIYGDYPGAIEAMAMAVNAGAPGDEATEWSRVQLGRLYEATGDLQNSAMHYAIALRERPDYAFALAGQARVAAAEKNYRRAIDYYRKADSMITDYSIREELADIYRLDGQRQRADSLASVIIDQLNKEENNGRSDENIGHYADRELAYAYLQRNNYDKALEHALMEYNRRPDNIDVNETVAWVYHCRNRPSDALPYLRAALRTHSKNPVLLCHAGLVYARAGMANQAKPFLNDAAKNTWRGTSLGDAPCTSCDCPGTYH